MPKLYYNESVNAFTGYHDKDEIILPQIIWHITERCTLSCPFCFAKKNGNEISIAQFEYVKKLLKKLNVLKIDLSGGEPLLHNDFIRIASTLFDEGFKLTITTSGAIRNENSDWLFNNLDKFARIIISIDGVGEIHDKIRGLDGLFEFASEFARKIGSIDSTKLRINTVITNYLLEQNRLKELCNFINDVGPTEWCLIEIHPANKANHNCVNNESIIIESLLLGQAFKRTKIITRKSNDYSDYWVLDADNTISKHSNTSVSEISLDLTEVSINDIVKEIKKRKVGIPMSVSLKNSEKSSVVAEVLENVKLIAEEKQYSVSVEKESSPDSKGEILIGIIIGVSTNIINDIIKYCINKVRSRREITDNEVIDINGETKKLNDYK